MRRSEDGGGIGGGDTYHFCVVCANAEQVYLIGEFNNWSTTSTPMEQTEPHVWQLSVQVPSGHAPCAGQDRDVPPESRFSYFVIDRQWLTGRAAFGTTYCLPGTWSAVVREKSARPLPGPRPGKACA